MSDQMVETTAEAAAERDSPGVIAPPPAIVIVGLGIGFGLQALLPSTSLPAALKWSLGGALLFMGLILAVSFFVAFRRAGTSPNVYKPATKLVTTGPYRLSRHPGYLAGVLIYIAIALMTDTLWALVPLVGVVVVFDRGLIAPEERHLERRFGAEFLAFKARTRRWL